jgi:hypothetical protein
MNITAIGFDLAKNVFQVHGVDQEGRVSVKRQLKRAQVAMSLMALALASVLTKRRGARCLTGSTVRPYCVPCTRVRVRTCKRARQQSAKSFTAQKSDAASIAAASALSASISRSNRSSASSTTGSSAPQGTIATRPETSTFFSTMQQRMRASEPSAANILRGHNSIRGQSSP